MTTARLSSILFFGALTACATEEQEPDNSLPGSGGDCGLVLEPSALDFGEQQVDGVGQTQTLVLQNDGDAACRIDGIAPQDPDGVFSVEGFTPLSLSAGAQTQVQVSYLPVTASDDSQVLEVLLDSGVLQVPLSGQGLAPAIAVSPQALELGGVAMGCAQEQLLSVQNVGNQDLVIDALAFNTESDELRFIQDQGDINGPLPWTLAPGSSLPVWVEYQPLDSVADASELVISSNDPLTPELTATQQGSGDDAWTVQDEFTLDLQPKADILIALDHSCSTPTEREMLWDSFPDLLESLEDQQVDFQLAVLVQDDGCVIGSEPFAHAGQSRAEQLAVLSKQMCLEEDASFCPYVGHNTERAFTLFEGALAEAHLEAGGCNQGLMRDGASLELLSMSTEAEQSAESHEAYVSRLQALKPDPQDLRIHGIGGDYPAGCEQSSDVSADFYEGLYEATGLTGGFFWSSCAESYSSYMQTLAQAVGPSRSSFLLSRPALPETVSVQVDGDGITQGWTHDPDSNRVLFADDSLPARGSQVTVSYADGECPE